MFVFNWFKDVLSSLGLFKKNAKILFLGLDNAGKTTLLRRLKDDRMVQFDPTIHAHAEELTLGNVNFKAYDLGGHETVRKTWKTYFPTVHGVIYLIDSADPTRFAESKKELDGLLATPELANVPFVILGNKIDKKDAVSEDEIRVALGLATKGTWGTEKVSEIDGRPIEVFMCSVAKKMGYAEGFRWLSKFIK
mmetsp:Transcript_11426/g.13099  ORF Transcript_11426/g.13099 Transcript_11426/m.13099 type:complete len:193 (+) Transcript_11426:52-630(+)|eukprot:CAMPEP_0176437184 /NCGR_PEP_ID=MMETSP0127-20121128/18455_1 /TAXON_ID=938130 /ORGANISM="Platyophrya macrostoma, Strain WH" /LENGTH=192 /DNA_ID=CAMNT_0017820731 /DNA_START=53 /DNA_END=631 /DNA_ORIENTATION=+